MIKAKVQKAAKAILPHILVVVFGIVTSAGVFAGGIWAVTAIAGALLIGLANALSGQRRLGPAREAVVTTVLFMAAVWLSCLPAAHQDVAIYGAIKMTTILVPLSLLFLPLDEKAVISIRDKTPFFLILASVSMVVMTGIVVYLRGTDPFSPYITKFNRGFSYFAILIWPLWAILFQSLKCSERPAFLRRVLWVSLVVLVMAALFNHSKTTALGLVCAFITFGLACWRPVWVRLMVPAFTLLLVAMPFWIGWVFSFVHAPVDGTLSSAWHRLEIWDYLHHYLVKDFTFLHGWGIANTSSLSVAGPNAEIYRYATDSAAHPHNAAVQIWGETGLTGVVALFYLLYWVFKGISRLPKEGRPYGWAAYVMALILAMSAYNFWTDSLWGALALTGVGFGVLTKEKPEN